MCFFLAILDPIQLLSFKFCKFNLYINIFCEKTMNFLLFFISDNFVKSGISSESDKMMRSSEEASLIPSIKLFLWCCSIGDSPPVCLSKFISFL